MASDLLGYATASLTCCTPASLNSKIEYGRYEHTALESSPIRCSRWIVKHCSVAHLYSAGRQNCPPAQLGDVTCQLDSHANVAQLGDVISQLDSHSNVAAYTALLRRCTSEKALYEGERLHDLMIRNGHAHDIGLNNLLLQMYGRCGSLQHASSVFGSIVDRNLYSWTIMLAALSQNGKGKEALHLFCQMQAEGFQPDKVTCICAFDACANVEALQEGREIHSRVVGNGWDCDVVVGSALVNMYGKCGSLEDARAVFADMPKKNVISWSAMVAACAQNGNGREALQLFAEMPAAGVAPNKITTLTVLGACASMEALEEGREIHTTLIGNGWESDVAVGNALVTMYGKCASLDDAKASFADMLQRNVVSWSAMIAACAQNGQSKEALRFWGEMESEGFEPDRITAVCVLDACANLAALEEGQQIHASVVGNKWESGTVLGNALINMYGKCRRLDDAKAVFAEMPLQNVVSWSAMITACAQNGHGKEALQLFGQMQVESFIPDKISFICVLDVCVSMAALDEGRDVHASLIANGWESDSVVGTALINMYGKCGTVDDARAAFAEIIQLNVVSWTAMIAVCAQNGHSKEALQLYGQMQAAGVKPDKITFICVLTACSHMGLIADGMQYFTSMNKDHGILPSVEHYICMIDLLGRAGHLEEAEQLINSMRVELATSAWLNLLTYCRTHHDVKRGICAANHLLELDEKNPSLYLLLANILAAAGRWDDVKKVRNAMIEKGVKQVPSRSCIEVNNVVHEFVGGDMAHPQQDQISAELQRLNRQIEVAGYVPQRNIGLSSLLEQHTEPNLCYHSERLAIAFGLISTSPGTPIRITKNLRVCSDCHSAAKFISKVIQQKITIRDSYHFHHIEHGVCSCGEY